jgi:hypothetical protein
MPEGTDKNADAAVTSVSTPAPRVGSSTGANSDEWFDGTSSSNLPAAIAVSTCS